MKRLLLAAALALSACATSQAPSTDIADTSFTATDGSRSIQLSAWLAAPPAEVYRTITTPEGWKTWAVPVAFGEPHIGGVLETSYDRNAKRGDAGNIQQQFIALIPDRLAVFRTIKTPAGFPNAELYMKTIAIMEIEPEAGGTRLTFTHQGFGTEPGFTQLYGFFHDGDKQTLEALQKAFTK